MLVQVQAISTLETDNNCVDEKNYGVTNYEILHEWKIWGIGKQWLKQMKEIRK